MIIPGLNLFGLSCLVSCGSLWVCTVRLICGGRGLMDRVGG